MTFELRLAECRSVRAGRALPNEHGGDVAKLKEAEPWLFANALTAASKGAMGLPNAGVASDDGKTMRRWREIAGVADDKE